jgi:phosphoribosylaminoimidazolecarboxamide formyltransferase/IMP cyclohydrolase
VIAVNRTVTRAFVDGLQGIFTEVLAAPDYDDDALDLLAQKKNLRVLKVPAAPGDPVEFRPISGGMVMQSVDRLQAEGDHPANWRLVAGDALDEAALADLAFAWRACRTVKSNAILLAHDGASVGIGMGQVNRVDSARLAVARAGDRARGAVAASDAFFPFPDGVEVLITGGVRAIVQPGGSIRDEEVFAAAAEAGVSMYVTGARHFFH